MSKKNTRVTFVDFLYKMFAELYEEKSTDKDKNQQKRHKKYLICMYGVVEIAQEETEEKPVEEEPFIDVSYKEVPKVTDVGNIPTNTPLFQGNLIEKVEKIHNRKIGTNSFVEELIKNCVKNKKTASILEAIIATCGFLQTVEALVRYLKSRGIVSALYLFLFLYSGLNTSKLIEDFFNKESPHIMTKEILFSIKILASLFLLIVLEWFLKTTFLKKLAVSLLCFLKKLKKA